MNRLHSPPTSVDNVRVSVCVFSAYVRLLFLFYFSFPENL